MFTANQVADWFLARTDTESGDTISHLKLQKLVYYAQAWHYTVFGNALFIEKTEAWRHGPVVRSIYNRFNHIPVYTQIDVTQLEFDVPKFSEDTTKILEEVIEIYGEHSSKYLEDLTHEEDPWIIARGGLADYLYCDEEITLESMKDYYSKKLNGAKE